MQPPSSSSLSIEKKNGTVDNTSSNVVKIGPTFVPADEQPHLGEQVVHGGDAL